MSLAKTKIKKIKVLISKNLIDSYINHDNFASVVNVPKNIMKRKKKPKTLKILWNILYKSNGNVLYQL